MCWPLRLWGRAGGNQERGSVEVGLKTIRVGVRPFCASSRSVVDSRDNGGYDREPTRKPAISTAGARRVLYLRQSVSAYAIGSI